jgi:hypothetical protein
MSINKLLLLLSKKASSIVNNPKTVKIYEKYSEKGLINSEQFSDKEGKR